MTQDESIVSSDYEQPGGEIELTPPEMYAAYLIEWAVDRHASDLFISDYDDSVVISARRMGRIEFVRRLVRGYGRRLQGHFRVLSGGDAGEMIRPTEGRGVVTTPSGGVVEMRLSCIPTLFGQDVSVRLFDPIRGARCLNDLGFDCCELAEVQGLLECPSGLILVAGPVASGKSSTLYAAIDYLNDGSRKIHTLEDPIEHSLSGIMQSQVNLRAGLDFADLLSVVLRHSPDVIMVGEIRDRRTAETAVRAGASGQLVLATIHAKAAVEAVASILQYGTNQKFLAGSLIGVINQRLIRRLCPDCRREVPLDENFEIPQPVSGRLGDERPRLFAAQGCDSCFNDGFTTLTCLPEIMKVSPSLAERIANSAPSLEVQCLATEQGMLTLAETAAVRVLRGETTAHEANRVTADPFLASLAARLQAST